MKLVKYLLLVILVVMAGCSVNEIQQTKEDIKQAKEDVQQAKEDVKTVVKETEKVVKEVEKTVEELTVLREEAAFVGLVDSNSIEVNTESRTMVLQISEVTDVDFESIETNAAVIIEYVEEANGQFTLKSLLEK